MQRSLNINPEQYKKRQTYNLGLSMALKKQQLSVINHSNKNAIQKHIENGKLLARERIHVLIDKNSEFLELSILAANGQYNNQFPSAGIVTGIGLIHGIACMIVANDATVKGGTYIKETIKKHLRAQEIAMNNNLPCVYLVDSGGIFLPEQKNVFPDRFDFGRIFYNQAQLSAKGIPQISVVMGSCTAGGAYVPAMSDQTIMVKNQGTIFIGGPPLVKAATGEKVTAEELGGAYVHTSISGVADYIANDDPHALSLCRELIEHTKQMPLAKPENFSDPELDIYELYGLIDEDEKKVPDPHEIIYRITDNSKFQEFKAEYAKNLITGFAKIMGIETGFIANNGFLTAETARKGAHFIQLCDQRQIPIVFLQNITGFIVGKSHEHAGIARDGAKFIHAVANAGVPKITVVTGGSYGAGNYAMAGRAFDPEFLFMWPNAKIAVMGGEQAASVLQSIKNQGETGKHPLIEQFEQERTAYFSTSRLWDDGIIDPVDTRKILGMTLSLVTKSKRGKGNYGVFRM
jgi:3-methylcrotonyl-CoA carboxylase beta subunit